MLSQSFWKWIHNNIGQHFENCEIEWVVYHSIMFPWKLSQKNNGWKFWTLWNIGWFFFLYETK